MTFYGTAIQRNYPTFCRDLIGDIGTTHAGNVYLRIGYENEPGGSWHQVAHIVLTPDETYSLIYELTEFIGESQYAERKRIFESQERGKNSAYPPDP